MGLMDNLARRTCTRRGSGPAADSAVPVPIRAWPERAVLVLAPHMDDEVLGCGGALVLHKRHGAHVAVQYLTDGSRGAAGLDDLGWRARRARRAALRATRHAEALAGAAVLGIDRCDFFDAPDGRLAGTGRLVDRLAVRLADFLAQPGPHLLYLPHHGDAHPDHRATARLAGLALARLARSPLRLRAYEVWQALDANCYADITAVHARKQRALACHASQLRDLDYARCVAGLNAWRSILADGRGQVEAFLERAPRLAAATSWRWHA